ncbi:MULTISPECIES: superoxide dismutase [Pseudoalteromonas]|uniref:Superoxide dismutase n=1 Tax=Pseudoalteromonas ruthenica TaxID=151081 RepID=A0A0F4Q4G4_9GAMM|nr:MULTISPECIES: superoxide dismutase [Pseudoalteromonas]KJY98203.1 superoxide dismutase [Pseudoalteromonas ruthenica]KJZ02270.1 superoxide dismutase [Pseudoalteromonas ruthenica]MCF2861135.1 superoxide dismutase [Pseudoalteromonas sp. CNAT2-18]MCG7557004.1 superoxide dismutase [Pseudoalteromonas sp. CNAT2-18.1]TMO89686.1 superoxide dismutase [Pseudoalteromonas ruthenica]|tara:strand:+ start:371 stop:985 length:615 start_codon:yes stop_codon:yes gene_type:complete
MAFQLPELAYGYDDLEPHIDGRTMEIHHTLHHQTYINKANDALKDSEYEGKGAHWLLRNIAKIDEALRPAVRDHVGGHANHSLFWQVMSPSGGTEPQGALAQAIKSDIGSWEAFKKQFTQAALTQFGSGWAWLVVDSSHRLQVVNSANQDSPLMDGLTPILGLDVWEHAYYLQYQNRRPEYIEAFYEVIDWPAVEALFHQATGR